ncbi:hypothetical protein [Microcoleus sp. PH2017_28_MFU_U_A]|uniref:hypothetical protein n=1 Tax=Microcoleus sp. PH2017_28_MFU_U_A TaxID=2798838 RepID=UPI001DA91B11|nr:hypothetical protein [Microcoleus sp. PH2017_28_MFU_U_A]MCC3595244.1 hypothetical protein [Microcoleus sp. PH2017_28_MFU_U_A]
MKSFIDMYNELGINPTDTWQEKYLGFFVSSSNVEALERLNWLANYFDCLTTELKTDSEFNEFASGLLSVNVQLSEKIACLLSTIVSK